MMSDLSSLDDDIEASCIAEFLGDVPAAPFEDSILRPEAVTLSEISMRKGCQRALLDICFAQLVNCVSQLFCVADTGGGYNNSSFATSELEMTAALKFLIQTKHSTAHINKILYKFEWELISLASHYQSIYLISADDQYQQSYSTTGTRSTSINSVDDLRVTALCDFLLDAMENDDMHHSNELMLLRIFLLLSAGGGSGSGSGSVGGRSNLDTARDLIVDLIVSVYELTPRSVSEISSFLECTRMEAFSSGVADGGNASDFAYTLPAVQIDPSFESAFLNESQLRQSLLLQRAVQLQAILTLMDTVLSTPPGQSVHFTPASTGGASHTVASSSGHQHYSAPSSNGTSNTTADAAAATAGSGHSHHHHHGQYESIAGGPTSSSAAVGAGSESSSSSASASASSSTGFRDRLSTLSMYCVGLVPLSAMTVRVALLFAAANKRFDVVMTLLRTPPNFNTAYLEQLVSQRRKQSAATSAATPSTAATATATTTGVTTDSEGNNNLVTIVAAAAAATAAAAAVETHIPSFGSTASPTTKSASSPTTTTTATTTATKRGGSDTAAEFATSVSTPPRLMRKQLSMSAENDKGVGGEDQQQQQLQDNDKAAAAVDEVEAVRRLAAADNGYKHFQRVTRSESAKILAGKPQGTFLVRPHDTGDDAMLFLSFVGATDEQQQGSSGGGGGTNIKHAIIRRETVTVVVPEEEEEGEGGEAAAGGRSAEPQNKNKQPSLPVKYSYRCGKVGPVNSLAEVLRVIANILPSGLLVDRPLKQDFAIVPTTPPPVRRSSVATSSPATVHESESGNQSNKSSISVAAATHTTATAAGAATAAAGGSGSGSVTTPRKSVTFSESLACNTHNPVAGAGAGAGRPGTGAGLGLGLGSDMGLSILQLHPRSIDPNQECWDALEECVGPFDSRAPPGSSSSSSIDHHVTVSVADMPMWSADEQALLASLWFGGGGSAGGGTGSTGTGTGGGRGSLSSDLLDPWRLPLPATNICNLFASVLTTLTVKAIHKQLSVYLAEIEDFLLVELDHMFHNHTHLDTQTTTATATGVTAGPTPTSSTTKPTPSPLFVSDVPGDKSKRRASVPNLSLSSKLIPPAAVGSVGPESTLVTPRSAAHPLVDVDAPSPHRTCLVRLCERINASPLLVTKLAKRLRPAENSESLLIHYYTHMHAHLHTHLQSSSSSGNGDPPPPHQRGGDAGAVGGDSGTLTSFRTPPSPHRPTLTLRDTVRIGPVESLLCTLSSFVSLSDRLLLAQLAPALPYNSSLSPALSPPGVLQGEMLLVQINQSIVPKAVRLPGRGCGNGNDHLADCYEPNDLNNWLHKVLNSCMSAGNHASTSAVVKGAGAASKYGRLGSRGLPPLLRRNNPNAGAAGGLGTLVHNTGVGGGGSHSTGGGSGVIYDMQMAVETVFEARKTRLEMLSNGLGLGSSHRGRDIISSLPGTSAAAAAATHDAAVILASAAITNVPDESAKLLSWLIASKLLAAVTKPPDIAAFQTASQYYRYRDPWEVKVLLDQNAACVRTRLGRYVYGPVSTHCANSILNPMLLLLTIPRDPPLLTGGYPLVNNQGGNVTGDGGYQSGSVGAVSGSDVVAGERGRHQGHQGQVVSVYQRNPAESFRKLWDSLRAESWLVMTLSTACDQNEREQGGPHGMEQPPHLMTSSITAEPMDPYHACLSRHLYRNSLFARLGMPHRFVAVLQVDIFGLKEVGGQKDNFSFAASASAMEVYAVLRLVKGTTRVSATATSSGNKTQYDGAVVTSLKRIEPNKSHSVVTATAVGGFGGFSGGGSSGAVGAGGVGGVGSHATEFAYREQSVIRFPLPEGVLSLTPDHEDIELPTRRETVDPTVASATAAAAAAAAATATAMDSNNSSSSNSSAGAGGGTTASSSSHLGGGSSLHTPPRRLILSLYERSFFSDSKLGELDLPLTALTDDRAFRDWLPLANDRGGTWFVHLQLQLRFLLMAVELPHMANLTTKTSSSSSSSTSAASSSVGNATTPSTLPPSSSASSASFSVGNTTHGGKNSASVTPPTNKSSLSLPAAGGGGGGGHAPKRSGSSSILGQMEDFF